MEKFCKILKQPSFYGTAANIKLEKCLRGNTKPSLSLNSPTKTLFGINKRGGGQGSEQGVLCGISQAGLETERTDISNNNMHNNVNAK